MRSIALFYGSTNGNTTAVAQLIQREFAATGAATVELFDIADFFLEEMLDFELLLLGIPTWDTGQLQKDWEQVFAEFDNLDLGGKRIALFGLGDQVGYPATFVDALCFLANKVSERGAQIVGRWPTLGYTFTSSWAVADGVFVGLVLDEDNQPELTELRVAAWVQQLLTEFELKERQ